MEDTLGDTIFVTRKFNYCVLILVLMEDTLGEGDVFMVFGKVYCLNPCSNGRYSRSSTYISDFDYHICLNPCSNGRYSRRVRGVKALFQVGGE